MTKKAETNNLKQKLTGEREPLNKEELSQEEPTAPAEPKQTLNLYQKINAVMQDVRYLAKDGKISFKSTNYKAITEEKVTKTVRESLIKHGLVILPIGQEHHKEGTLTTVNVTYKIVDSETGQSETLVSSGTGADTQDKGVGKAMTYAYKYLLLRTFAIPTGEDTDQVSSAELDAIEQAQKEKIRLKKDQFLQKVGEFAELRNAKSDQVLNALQIDDLGQLNEKQIQSLEQVVNKWIVKAKQENEQGNAI